MSFKRRKHRSLHRTSTQLTSVSNPAFDATVKKIVCDNDLFGRPEGEARMGPRARLGPVPDKTIEIVCFSPSENVSTHLERILRTPTAC